MSNEKPSESGHWKERLDRLSSLPGDPWTGKEASWESIHDRINDKSGRRKTPFYWMAAASVLVGLVTCLAIVHERQKRFAKANAARPDPAVSFHGGAQGAPAASAGRAPFPADSQYFSAGPLPSPAVGSGPKQTEQRGQAEPLDRTEQTGQTEQTALAETPAFHIHRVPQKAVYPTRISTSPTSVEPATRDSADEALSIKETTPVKAGAPSLRKLRVIHVNELDNTPEKNEAPEYAKAPILPGKYLIHIGIRTKGVYSEWSAERQEPAASLVHIRIH